MPFSDDSSSSTSAFGQSCDSSNGPSPASEVLILDVMGPEIEKLERVLFGTTKPTSGKEGSKMDLKASDRLPCKSCGQNGQNMVDKFYSNIHEYYIFCRPCSDQGLNNAAKAEGNNRIEALKRWNAQNSIDDEEQKTTLDTSKMKDKELAKKVKALLESNDEEISTTTLNNCPVCNGKMKLMPVPYKTNKGDINIKIVVVPEDPACQDHHAYVGNDTHADSNGKKWVFTSPEGAIYAFNKLYPRPVTDEMRKAAGLPKSHLVLNTRPEDKTLRQYTWDDLSLPEDTELRYTVADEWTRVSISPDTLPVA